MEEAADNAWLHALVDGQFCEYDDMDPFYHTEKRDTYEALRDSEQIFRQFGYKLESISSAIF